MVLTALNGLTGVSMSMCQVSQILHLVVKVVLRAIYAANALFMYSDNLSESFLILIV